MGTQRFLRTGEWCRQPTHDTARKCSRASQTDVRVANSVSGRLSGPKKSGSKPSPCGSVSSDSYFAGGECVSHLVEDFWLTTHPCPCGPVSTEGHGSIGCTHFRLYMTKIIFIAFFQIFSNNLFFGVEDPGISFPVLSLSLSPSSTPLEHFLYMTKIIFIAFFQIFSSNAQFDKSNNLFFGTPNQQAVFPAARVVQICSYWSTSTNDMVCTWVLYVCQKKITQSIRDPRFGSGGFFRTGSRTGSKMQLMVPVQESAFD